jgi:hypothetical protein
LERDSCSAKEASEPRPTPTKLRRSVRTI